MTELSGNSNKPILLIVVLALLIVAGLAFVAYQVNFFGVRSSATDSATLKPDQKPGEIEYSAVCAEDTIFRSLEEAAKNPDKVCELNLSEKGLTDFPVDLDKFTNLTKIILTKNNIKEIPPSLFELANLSTLDLNYNQITQIPSGIDKLKKLQVLSMAANMLTEVPAEVGNLESLLALGLSYNDLVTLPDQISKLKNLKILYAISNEFSDSEKERIKSLLPQTEIHFD